MLLNAKANVNVFDRHQKTPLHRCIELYGSITVARKLVNAKANVNTKDIYQQTPLYLAAQRGEIDIVQLLIDNNADVDFDGAGSTALHFAAGSSPDILEMLLEAKASVDVRDCYLRTPLHLAASRAPNSSVKQLLHALIAQISME